MKPRSFDVGHNHHSLGSTGRWSFQRVAVAGGSSPAVVILSRDRRSWAWVPTSAEQITRAMAAILIREARMADRLMRQNQPERAVHEGGAA